MKPRFTERDIETSDYYYYWQPCILAARANVSSSDRSELLLSLRGSGRMVLSVASNAFPLTGFAVAWLGPFVTQHTSKNKQST